MFIGLQCILNTDPDFFCLPHCSDACLNCVRGNSKPAENVAEICLRVTFDRLRSSHSDILTMYEHVSSCMRVASNAKRVRLFNT